MRQTEELEQCLGFTPLAPFEEHRPECEYDWDAEDRIFDRQRATAIVIVIGATILWAYLCMHLPQR